MNAMLRRIDLVCKILSPVITGQIMTFGSPMIASIFIASWNVVSMFVEYALLAIVYRRVPALAIKNLPESSNGDVVAVISDDPDVAPSQSFPDKSELVPAQASYGSAVAETPPLRAKPPRPSVIRLMFLPLIDLVSGWRVYVGNTVAYAGMGLAFLYMTVLGFDSVTTGYAKTRGMTESLIGVAYGLGAVFGVSGTFAYPRMVKSVGLERTGLFALFFQNVCLTFCFLAVFMPGSPWEPLFPSAGPLPANSSASNLTNGSATAPTPTVLPPGVFDFSIFFLMFGIVTARFGLWTADLTISQMLLERVPEKQRGAVNGVQKSLCMLMDTIKFLLVILIPMPSQFGYLVIVSYVFCTIGAILYAAYSYKVRGHLVHWDKTGEFILAGLAASQWVPNGVGRDLEFSNDPWLRRGFPIDL